MVCTSAWIGEINVYACVQVCRPVCYTSNYARYLLRNWTQSFLNIDFTSIWGKFMHIYVYTNAWCETIYYYRICYIISVPFPWKHAALYKREAVCSELWPCGWEWSELINKLINNKYTSFIIHIKPATCFGYTCVANHQAGYRTSNTTIKIQSNCICNIVFLFKVLYPACNYKNTI